MARRRSRYQKTELPSRIVGKRRGIIGYRMIRVRPGVLIRVAITRKRGPRGGRTVAMSELKARRT